MGQASGRRAPRSDEETGNGGHRKQLAAAHRRTIRGAGEHGVSEPVLQDQRSNINNGNFGPGSMLQEEPRKEGRSGRDVGRNRNVTME
jgi:hypothetical protein